MKNSINPSKDAKRGYGETARPRLFRIKRLATATLFAATVLVAPLLVQGQRQPLNVTDVSSTAGAGGTTVSIAADGSLRGAQTWQDTDGYHVVIPNTRLADSIKSARGLKVRRVGSSVEILVQTKPGARVNIESSDNKLQLGISGKLDPRPSDFDPASASTSEDARQSREQQYSNPGGPDGQPSRLPSDKSSLPSDKSSTSIASSAETAQNSSNSNPQVGPQVGAPEQTSAVPAPAISSTEAASEIEIQPEDDGLVASVFSGSTVFVVMALGLFGLLVSRKLRSRQAVAAAADSLTGVDVDEVVQLPSLGANNGDAGTSLVKSGQSARPNDFKGTSTSSGLARQTTNRAQVAGPTSLFGAYRIDQEVGKLVFGQPHRLDVLSSRAIDDRRAIEASLVKSVNSPDLDEDGRRKAREALEEYGFVARQCAALLLASDAFERTSAARALGEIKSATALPFLLEGLYDSESIVRNQAVLSIGELKLPAAIGALLDIARTHPDVPSGLLSRALSACSVEGLDFFDAVMPEPALLGTGLDNDVVEQITHLEPTSSVEELPEALDDERLTQALTFVVSSDVQERAEGLKTLAQFRVQSAIAAMTLVARNDPEPNLRSVAISSLGTINHESVFPAILIGTADEAREVRASAARSLNRLSFDRSEAYVRVIETSDDATIIEVAKACIQAGIVSQNLDRLSTSDHRQAYETFSLICLLAKAKMNQPVLDAISDHANGDVRIKAVHLLACTGQPEVFGQLRELAVKDGIKEDVKTALLEALYKIDQAQSKEEKSSEPTAASESPVAAENDENTPAPAQVGVSPVEAEVINSVEPENHFEFGPMLEVESLEEVEE